MTKNSKKMKKKDTRVGTPFFMSSVFGLGVVRGRKRPSRGRAWRHGRDRHKDRWNSRPFMLVVQIVFSGWSEAACWTGAGATVRSFSAAVFFLNP
jgi:hypothetical protein